ncbi:MAG: sugar nucleotide-binding protein, partial [Pseudomonadota bacterium]
ADACLALAPRLIEGTAGPDGHGIFHCTGGGEVTWCGFARAIIAASAERTGHAPPVDAITTAEFPTPARRPAYSVLDNAKLARVHGITMPPWQEGLDAMLDEVLGAGAPTRNAEGRSG